MKSEFIVGHNIKRIREDMGFTQKDLATLTGLTDKAISEIESGKTNPRRSSLKIIAEALKCDIDEIYGTSKNPPLRGDHLIDAAEILSRIANLPHEMRLVVLALIYKDPNILDELSPSVAESIRPLVESQ